MEDEEEDEKGKKEENEKKFEENDDEVGPRGKLARAILTNQRGEARRDGGARSLIDEPRAIRSTSRRSNAPAAVLSLSR